MGVLSDTCAQQVEPAEDRVAQARHHYTRGAAAFAAGDHDEAVARFMTAYELDPRGPLLLNIAQALRLKTPPDCEGAHRYYELFLASEPHAPERSEVRQHMVTMQDCVANQRRARAQADEAIAGAAPSPSTRPAPSSPGAARWLTVGGGLLTLTGALLYARVRVRYGELREACPCSDALVDRWQRLSYGSYALLGAGLSTTLAGVSLWSRAAAPSDASDPNEARTRDRSSWPNVGLRFAHGGIGLWLEGRY